MNKKVNNPCGELRHGQIDEKRKSYKWLWFLLFPTKLTLLMMTKAIGGDSGSLKT